MRDMVTAVPGVQRGKLIQSDRPSYRMNESAMPIRVGE
jgi:hypothetical protein